MATKKKTPTKSMKPLKACRCFDMLEEELCKSGKEDVCFTSLDTAISFKNGGFARVVLPIYVTFETPRLTRDGLAATPKKTRTYVLAEFCPICGVKIDGRSL